MKYKVGDKVRIKSLDWYNANKSKSHGTVACGGKYFDYDMREWCGKTMTILDAYQTCYIMKEDGAKDLWTDEMIEGLMESIDCKKCGLTRMSTRCLFMDNCPHNQPKNTIEIPEDWVLKDENGNVINATKIVLEKKKKEYPKTYDECCEVLGYEPDENEINCYQGHLIESFVKLLICRDAYWKIAGEELGLSKSWEPDYDYSSPSKYIISCYFGDIIKEEYCGQYNRPLSFPTPEIRDAFKENFDPDIEICKELL